MSESRTAESPPTDGDGFNYSSHWVTRVINYGWPVGGAHPLLSSVIKFGTLPNLFTVYLLAVRGELIGIDFTTGIVFGTLWINLGPFLIWYYDEQVLPTFFEKCSRAIDDERRVRQLARKYDRLFSRRSWLLYVPWSAALIVIYWLIRHFLESAGVFEIGSLIYFSFYGVALYLGVMAGVGFMGVVTTLLAIREVSSEPLTIDPLHPDGLGGLSFVGYYAIRTTVTFSSGSLYFPLAFAVAGSRFRPLIIGVMVVYMATILASFVYPTIRVNRKASEIREANLEQLRRDYEQAYRESERFDEVGDSTDTQELVKQLELQRLRNEYEDYRTVSLYPMEVWILIRLVSSIILPVVFILIDSYFKNIIKLLL